MMVIAITNYFVNCVCIADKPAEPQVRSVDELRQENIDLKREVLSEYQI